MRLEKVEAKPLFSFGFKGTPLEVFFVPGIGSPRGAGWAERSDPERSDGSRSGAQPAPRVLALIPVCDCCTGVPSSPRPWSVRHE